MSTLGRGRTPRRGQAGSAAVEVVIGVPAFILLVSLVLLGGRLAITHQAVQSAASDAARAASLSRTASAARAAATQAAHASLDNQQVRCAATQVAVDANGFLTPAGTPASVSVAVSCTVRLGDLGLPGESTRVVTATMSSPLDTYRGRR